MPRVPNHKAKEYVINLKPFQGCNIYGSRLAQSAYCVFSYTARWPLYLHYNCQWYGNSGWYSTTTTRHQRLLRPADNVVELPRALLELFVVYLTGQHFPGEALASLIRTAGFIPQSEQRVVQVPAPQAAPFSMRTHLANAVVDFGAVHRRRVIPV